MRTALETISRSESARFDFYPRSARRRRLSTNSNERKENRKQSCSSIDRTCIEKRKTRGRKETTGEKKFKREGAGGEGEEEEEEEEEEGGEEEEGVEEEKEIRGELVIPFRLELRGSAIRHSIAYTHSRVRQGDNNQLFWSI